MDSFLYDELLMEFGKRTIERITIPNTIEDNLNPKFEIRPYQKEAFQRFILFYDEVEFRNKFGAFHILYNMATGSGKTLIMAGLILYLYEKGYRNFIFFVHSTNIIDKTKDNFLNVISTKYLFNHQLVINNRNIVIKTVENFDEADEQNINIKFTTVQKLHTDLENPKENNITHEDFEGQKVVLLGDEAHHFSSKTKKKNSSTAANWENTVLTLLKANSSNILLEFTATLDYDSREINDKYRNKVLFKYDLKHFREDKYSKEINIVRSFYEEDERILQALILNQYRQELATKYGINLKPVILFKAKRTIAESERNKVNFHQLIANLSAKQVQKIQQTSTVEVVQRAFYFFNDNQISLEEITERLKNNFRPDFCISANNDKEAERNQMILNSLEDDDNPVRAIFAVQKLNEGWDVLNLFDIVRLYEGRDSKGRKLGKTTIAEAQLIGRGARYFPFKINDTQSRYQRKYDKIISTDSQNLKILEELFYHTKEDSRYITEIKQALIENGAMEDDRNLKEVEIRIKPSFKKTKLYQKGVVYINSRKPSDYKHIHSFKDLNLALRNISYPIASGSGRLTNVFQTQTKNVLTSWEAKDIQVKNFPLHILRFALSKNPFYHFNTLQHRFPYLKSIRDFICNDNYLGGLFVTFKGTTKQLNKISNQDYLMASIALLEAIQEEIKGNSVQYAGTDFQPFPIHKIFKNKTLRVPKDAERANGQKDFVANKDWFVFDANYGTSEEKRFVEMFERRFKYLKERFDDIYILRNERFFGIYNQKGQRFEPDFVLYAIQKSAKKPITYQVFIEPKGSHLIKQDQWKADFLETLRAKGEIIEINTDKYQITGLPFYHVAQENKFISALEKTLKLKN